MTDQLMTGIRGDGRKIEPPYTPFTQSIKREKGQPTDRVTLKDTGDFHESIFSDDDRFPVLFDFRDWKRNKLFEKYGEEISELTKESKDELSEELKDEITTEFKKQIV